jgi:hypothetical protein
MGIQGSHSAINLGMAVLNDAAGPIGITNYEDLVSPLGREISRPASLCSSRPC